MKPIVALSTPPSNSAVHIIRLSGDGVYDIINKICETKIIKKGYQIQRVNIVDNKRIIDNVLINKFIKPKSFTGEDVIEINCHGGYYLSQKIIKLLLSHGCKLAKPGEFTMRAVLNNKINLIQAQAINNLINTKNDYGIASANQGLSNSTNQKILLYKKILFDLIAKLEITIDYPDMDSSINKKLVLEKINELIKEFEQIIKISSQTAIFVQGINIAIIGDVNVGKSSLLNAFLNQERAIVTKIPGTTRDVIQASVNIDKLTFNFFDTAGIRQTKNKIENIGINKSMNAIKNADLILHVIDGSKPITKQFETINKLIKNKKVINVINKSDLKQATKINGIKVSAKNKNIDLLLKEIKKQFKSIDLSDKNILILQSQSSIELFKDCLNKLTNVKRAIHSKSPFDIIVQDLHMILNDILEITGEKKDFNFINKMFKEFCVGK